MREIVIDQCLGTGREFTREALQTAVNKALVERGMQLQKECAETAQLNQNETYWNLSHRAIVIAWLKVCVLYVANGQKWERAIDDFIRWSLHYDMFCKMVLIPQNPQYFFR